MNKTNKIYFRNLDSIRFIAALMVFLHHGMNACYKYLGIQGTVLERFLNAISNGGTGVSLFFVLSGFLITYIILSEIELTQKFSLKNFYIRRILRIWPLYFAVVILSFAIFPALQWVFKTNTVQGANVLYQLAFLSNFDVMKIEKFRPGTDVMMQDITWSVAIEEQFYAFWPLIFALLPRKLILHAILTVAASSLVFRFFNSTDSYVLYYHTFAVMIDLATGALFAYFIIVSKRVKRFFQNTGAITILGTLILFFFSLMYQDVLFSSKIGWFLERPYFALLYGFIIATQSMIVTNSALEFGNLGWARRLGKYTYGMYLLHPVALEMVHVIYRLLHIKEVSLFPLFIEGVCGLMVTILISWLSYKFYETRFLKLKSAFGIITKE